MNRVLSTVLLLVGFICFALAEQTQLSEVSSEVLMAEDTLSQVGEGDELTDMDDVEISSSCPDQWMTNRYANDTLFLSCDQESLPYKIVVRTTNGDVVYRLSPQFILGDTSSLMIQHPADSIYRHMWTNMHVNPYGNMFDSLTDDVHIPMDGFTLPAPGYITSKYGWRRYRMHKICQLKKHKLKNYLIQV